MRRPAALLSLLLMLPGACGGDEASQREEPADGPPVVWASAATVRSIVTRIAGDRVTLTGPGGATRDFRPTRSDLQALQAADRILLNGAGAEPWAETAFLPRSRVTDSEKNGALLGRRL